MYKAIYREYRPKTFDEVIGQEETVKILKNQVEYNKIGHAYIFSGTRGTGKTSCAKIFSRAVNCLNPVGGNPCNECINCLSILDESTIDVVEMDAASNRRIDDIRDLRDKVIYPPANLKYKVYIIDEAHMITNEGFNALLKIMEEPPSHLIFILATTELDRIPRTILSRCQKFEFKRISQEGIEKSIQNILNDMGVNMDAQGVSLIARAGDGAMRDAQSILDQVLSVRGDQISYDQVVRMLGSVGDDDLFELVDAVINEDLYSALSLVRSQGNKGVLPSEIISGLCEHFRNLILSKASGELLKGYGNDVVERYIVQSKKLDTLRLTDSIEILMNAKSRTKTNEQTDIVLEMAILRLIDYVDRKDLISRLASLEREFDRMKAQRPEGNVLSERRWVADADAKSDAARRSKNDDTAITNTEAVSNVEIVPEITNFNNETNTVMDEKSPEAIYRNDKTKQSVNVHSGKVEEVKQLEAIISDWNNCITDIVSMKKFWGIWIYDLVPLKYESGTLTLQLPPDQQIGYKKALAAKDELAELVGKHYGIELRIEIENSEKDNSKKSNKDDDLKRIRDFFGADIVKIK